MGSIGSANKYNEGGSTNVDYGNGVQAMEALVECSREL